MKKRIAIDLGFGNVKVCYQNSQGISRYEKFISAIGKAGKSAAIKDSNAFEYNGQTYYVFETALKLPKESLLDLTTYEGLKEASPIFISYLFKRYGIVYDEIVLGLSMAMLEQSADYLNYLSTNLAMKEDSFRLIPQGIGSKIAYERYNRNPNDPTQYNDIKIKNYLGVDIGFNTIDIYQCIGGHASGNTIEGFKNLGVCRVAYGLIDQIKRDHNFEITIQHAKEILETGVLIRRGTSVDYTQVIDNLIKGYFKEVIEMIEKKYSSVIDNMDNIIFVGGGAALLNKYKRSIDDIIEKYYKGDFIVIPEVPEYYNVLGYYLINWN